MASVLVVDDHAANRELLEVVVVSQGHTVLMAGSGAEALALARTERPDLIIADILMPVMDGYELARLVRSEPALATTRMIFCTASYIQEEVQRLASGCGVEHFLFKPCEPEQIIATVREALAAGALAAPPVPPASFDRDHMQVVNNQLLSKVDELEALSTRLEEANDALALSEQEFRLLFEQNPQPMLVYEVASLAIVAVNEALCRTYGYSREELLLMDLTDLNPPEDVELVLSFLAANPPNSRIRFSTGFAGRMWRHQRKDSSIIDIEAASDAIQVAGIDCRIAVFHDVTERNRATAERAEIADALATELTMQNERLREVNQLKDQFVAVVSHELRTPLTAIRGYLEIVRGGEPGPLTSEQERCLEIIDGSCKQLLRVVGDLLLIGKSEAGQLMLDIAEVDTAALLEECVVAATPAAEAKSLDLRVDGAEVHATLAGDAGRLAQAVGNVISNAIKFTAEGRVEVCLTADEAVAAIEIVDTGGGVPESEVEHLFVPFFRATGATRQAIPGSGLGLSIAKEIIEAHGGTISLKSEIGSGTAVRIELPVGGLP